MEKFIKSIFQSPSQEKISIRHEDLEGDGDSPISDRRKLSMSRSGRLKQSYKKRNSLSLELYGKDADIQPIQKQKSMEYHVHSTVATAHQTENSRKTNVEASSVPRNVSKSPEEEIDSAFEIIDKS